MNDKDTPNDEGPIDGKDWMMSLDNRLRKLEQLKAYVGGGIIVAVVLIMGFFGFTNFYQIPQEVKRSVSTAISEYLAKEMPQVSQKLKNYIDESKNASEETARNAEKTRQILSYLQEHNKFLRVESGNIYLNHKDNPDLRRTDQCPSERGSIGERIEFSIPFKETPRVVLSLNLLDHVMGQNLRITADVAEIDTHGFSYNLNTWCNTDIWAVRAAWIAYGH